MAVSVVTDSDFEEKVLKSESPIMVDFHADWCGPCKMAEPVLEELSDEYKGKVDIMKIDVDQNKETSMKYQVMSIPTTILFKGGEVIDKQIGFAGKNGFEELIKKGI